MADRECWSMAQELDVTGVGLTSWECDFLDDVLKLMRQGKYLTDRQREKLYQIHEARVP